jgi:WhiB family redox-sensing transcriptional regulator
VTALAIPARNWAGLASCRTADPEIFFPEVAAEPGADAGNQQAAALSFCSVCPVRPECLAYALGNGVADGIWGGLTGVERQASRLAAPAEPPLCPSGRHLRIDAGVTGDGKCRACRLETWRRQDPPSGPGRGRAREPRERDADGHFVRADAA